MKNVKSTLHMLIYIHLKIQQKYIHIYRERKIVEKYKCNNCLMSQEKKKIDIYRRYQLISKTFEYPDIITRII